jgi:hypothetical protein
MAPCLSSGAFQGIRKEFGTGLEITHFPLSITYREAIYSPNFSSEISHVLRKKELYEQGRTIQSSLACRRAMGVKKIGIATLTP